MVVPDHSFVSCWSRSFFANCCSRSFFANGCSRSIFCKWLFQIILLQIVIPDHSFCKWLFQIILLWIVVPDHFLQIVVQDNFLQMVVQYHFLQIFVSDHFLQIVDLCYSFANCWSRSFFCTLLMRIILLQIIDPDHFWKVWKLSFHTIIFAKGKGKRL